jgi:hypothetical protein
MNNETQRHQIKITCPVVEDPHILTRIETKLDDIAKEKPNWNWAFQNVKRIYWLAGTLLSIALLWAALT